MDQNSESTPGAAPVVAPSSQDLAATAAAQDAAWDDTTTDVGGGDVAADGTVTDGDVITDKPGIAAVVPAPKPGVPAEAAKPDAAKPAEVKPGEQDEEAAAVEVTSEKKAKTYWDKVTAVFPGAANVVDTPKFKAWFATLPEADQAAGADLDKADDAVRLMGRFYEDAASGRVKEPEPPAPPKPFEIGEYLTGRNIADVKIKKADGTETTLGEMAKPEEFGEVIGAIGAMTRASEQAIVGHFQGQIQQLTGQINQLMERLGANDLSAKVSDAGEVIKDPAFAAFRDRSPLLKNAWASGDPTNRAEVINMFKAEKARTTVTDAGASQRRTTDAKNRLHTGSLRGGGPGSARPAGDDKTAAEQQDAAWDTPLDVEGQKV